mmetsp:Transcript_41668/g.130551  ORF Transcript_41668/g.130551 Transcript_41668/m.130551 type:complete len:199 (+) Transcript_41668:288-884(+)
MPPAATPPGAEEEVEVMHIDTGDMIKVKQVLDEAAVVALAEMDYEEDYFTDNIKLTVMVISCAFAMVAQFYPMPFPDSRPLLAVCCAGYFVFSCILQFIVTYIDKDTIMFIKPKMEVTGSDNRLLLKSNFPRFDETYKLGIVLEDPKKSNPDPKGMIEGDFYIGDYFDRDGNFAEDVFVQAVQDLVGDFEQAQEKKGN